MIKRLDIKLEASCSNIFHEKVDVDALSKVLQEVVDKVNELVLAVNILIIKEVYK